MKTMLPILTVFVLFVAGEVLSQTCSPVMCMMYCKHGFKKDAMGCDMCECNLASEKCPPECNKFCPNGFMLDARGCPTCKCLDPQYPPHCGPVCHIGCPNGLEVDSKGCPICKCKV